MVRRVQHHKSMTWLPACGVRSVDDLGGPYWRQPGGRPPKRWGRRVAWLVWLRAYPTYSPDLSSSAGPAIGNAADRTAPP